MWANCHHKYRSTIEHRYISILTTFTLFLYKCLLIKYTRAWKSRSYVHIHECDLYFVSMLCIILLGNLLIFFPITLDIILINDAYMRLYLKYDRLYMWSNSWKANIYILDFWNLAFNYSLKTQTLGKTDIKNGQLLVAHIIIKCYWKICNSYI